MSTTAPKRSRAESTALTRARIMDAARELLAERPYSEVSMAEIGERAGIAFSAITYHFGSKRGLLVAIFAELTEAFDTLVDGLDGSLEGDAASLDEISSWYSTVTRRGVMLVAETLRDPELAELMGEYFARLLDTSAELFGDDHAEIEAQALISMGLGAIFLKQILPERIDHLGALGEGAALMLAGIADRDRRRGD